MKKLAQTLQSKYGPIRGPGGGNKATASPAADLKNKLMAKKAEYVFEKLSFHTERAGGTIAGGAAGGYGGYKLVDYIQNKLPRGGGGLIHTKFLRKSRLAYPAVMLPLIAAGALVGNVTGKAIDKAIK